jgi:hypothetical protein
MDGGMDVEIDPEPSREEREAIERALAARPGEPPDPRGAWWREGVRENVSPEAEPS